MQEYATEAAGNALAGSYARVGGLVDWMSGERAVEATHAEVEDRLHTEGMQLLCQLLQGQS